MMYALHRSSMLDQLLLLLLAMHCGSPSVCLVAWQLGTLCRHRLNAWSHLSLTSGQLLRRRPRTIGQCWRRVGGADTDQWSENAQCLTPVRVPPTDVHCIHSIIGDYSAVLFSTYTFHVRIYRRETNGRSSLLSRVSSSLKLSLSCTVFLVVAVLTTEMLETSLHTQFYTRKTVHHCIVRQFCSTFVNTSL